MPLVYWIRYPEHQNLLIEGYVGITTDLNKRIKQHKKLALRNPNGPKDEALVGDRATEIVVDHIFSGTAAECVEEEKRLRPKKHIGWNLHAGGGYNGRSPEEVYKRRLLQGRISQRQYDRLIEEINNDY